VHRTESIEFRIKAGTRDGQRIRLQGKGNAGTNGGAPGDLYVIVRTGIEVDPITARVTVAGDVPTIFKGIPLRMKTLSVAINRQGFLINPTNCGALTVNTTLTSTFGATQALSTPFQATNCSALAFKPKFSASSNGKTSRANGAALNTKIGYPSGVQANIKSVLVTLPKQLPSRLSTLKNACREAVFNANPFSCPSNSRVGGATVRTPVLPEKLTGPAFFVSHGGAAFPDLDFVLHGNGITVIMVGNTNISKGITTTKFASVPDVPVSSFEANLPVGPNSAVTANGSLCKQSLIMPTTITAQNGKVIKQNTKISVSGCPVTVVSSHARGNKAIVTVRAPAAGRVSGGGSNLKTVYRRPGKAQNVTLEVPLTTTHRPLAVRVRVGFIPKKGASSVAHTPPRAVNVARISATVIESISAGNGNVSAPRSKASPRISATAWWRRSSGIWCWGCRVSSPTRSRTRSTA